MSGRVGRSALSWRQLRDPWTLLSTGFGCGLAPIAPGTVGSLLGTAVWWFVFADLDFATRAVAALAAFLVGTLVVERAARRRGLDDDPAIVLDEVVGVWFALLFVPKSIPWVAGAFVLFRIADIAKPWPISRVDARVAGGLGVMADDLIAGLMAAVLVVVAWYVLS